jgi:hypothetical protein
MRFSDEFVAAITTGVFDASVLTEPWFDSDGVLGASVSGDNPQVGRMALVLSDWFSGKGLAEALAILALARDETVIANVTDAELDRARVLCRAAAELYEQYVQPWLAGLDAKPMFRAYVEAEGSEPFPREAFRRRVAFFMLVVLGVFRRWSTTEGAAAIDRLTARMDGDTGLGSTSGPRRQRAA